MVTETLMLVLMVISRPSLLVKESGSCAHLAEGPNVVLAHCRNPMSLLAPALNLPVCLMGYLLAIEGDAISTKKDSNAVVLLASLRADLTYCMQLRQPRQKL